MSSLVLQDTDRVCSYVLYVVLVPSTIPSLIFNRRTKKVYSYKSNTNREIIDVENIIGVEWYDENLSWSQHNAWEGITKEDK